MSMGRRRDRQDRDSERNPQEFEKGNIHRRLLTFKGPVADSGRRVCAPDLLENLVDQGLGSQSGSLTRL